ncbi:YkvA family protein [Mangrovibrevibacter kandeliae]|uniref:YkvA family protein n=1 Tax=Mangrovibrevibacter kandeliae TaxID=2968473 RepID=UPI0021180120|nr:MULTISPECIES: YkvA family protein [unclassified Aurantimonas]MCQ8781920.1 YkvA family protein [Aurantimonas sp. CSK15Z-1]MCW4115423.1 YkvA family protein [Aurantimonas sp. MSK8Z-1]
MPKTPQLTKLDIAKALRPGSREEQKRREERVRSSFFDTVRRALRHIPFIEDVVASYYCALDPETPLATRGILLAALAYFVLPMDIIPDFLLGFGFTDDIAVLWAAFNAVRDNIRPEHYARARAALGDLQNEDRGGA